VDNYGNVFFCRKGNPPIEFEQNDGRVETELIRTAKQPIITTEEEDVEKYWNDAATQYGLAEGEESECKGISYIEILCRILRVCV
jgi:hypothetical protein